MAQESRKNCKPTATKVNWFGTIWQESYGNVDEVKEKLKSFSIKGRNNVRSYVFQEEKCPKTGKIHCHFYLRLQTTDKMVHKFRDVFGDGWYNTVEVKSRGYAISYCTKEDTRVNGPFFFGDEMTDAFIKKCKEDFPCTKLDEAEDNENVEEKEKPKADYGETKLFREHSYEMAKIRQEKEQNAFLTALDLKIDLGPFLSPKAEKKSRLKIRSALKKPQEITETPLEPMEFTADGRHFKMPTRPPPMPTINVSKEVVIELPTSEEEELPKVSSLGAGFREFKEDEDHEEHESPLDAV